MLTLDRRPFSFKEMIGQKTILREMETRARKMDFPEVMLFCGPSGTGKTTLAYIISALLNDKNPLHDADGTPEPNPESPSSKDIINTRFVRDILFKDASSMSKDDVLSLSSEVASAPMYDKNRVVIIDECFSKNTPILVKDVDGTPKSMRIADVKEGDEVYVDTSLKTTKKVLHQFVHYIPLDRLRIVTIQRAVDYSEKARGECILTTADHKFLVHDDDIGDGEEEGHWVEADNLKRWDDILYAPFESGKPDIRCRVLSVNKFNGVDKELFRNGNAYGWYYIDSIGMPELDWYRNGWNEWFGIDEMKDGCVPMYDLEVEDVHRYFAGGVLVHNCQELGRFGKGAMLTFLEKKRKGTYIIMCTMDESAFDKSIKSRATIYRFQSPTEDEIAKYLFNYTQQLNLPVNNDTEDFYTEGLYAIAGGCDGSVRMALQMLDRCIQGGIYRASDIESEFGVVSSKKFENIFYKLLHGDMDVMNDVLNLDPEAFYRKLLSDVANAYLYRTTGCLKNRFRAKLYESVSTSALKVLLNVLDGVERNGYFRKDFFYVALADGVKEIASEGKSTEAQTSRRRVPV